MDPDAFAALHPDEYVKAFCDAGARPDGRAIDAARPLVIERGESVWAGGATLSRHPEGAAGRKVQDPYIRRGCLSLVRVGLPPRPVLLA